MNRRIVFTLLFLLSFVAVSADAETGGPAGLQKKVESTIDLRQITQKKEDAWAGEKAELMARYRSLKTNRDHLKKVKIRTEQMLALQKARINEIERRIEESARIREELQSYLESVVARLETWISDDLPFLSRERTDRIDSVKEILADPDKTAAERYRRAMEALQVETEYGRTVEVHQETIDLNSQSVLVDILRLGRISLFCQSLDGRVVGHYDREINSWISLPSKYRRDINKAVEIARRERSVELVRLPLGRIIAP